MIVLCQPDVRNLGNQVRIELKPSIPVGACEMPDLVESNPAGPGEKAPFLVKLGELLPQHQAAPLKHILGIRMVRKNREDVSKQFRTIARELSEEELVRPLGFLNCRHRPDFHIQSWGLH